MKFQIHGKEFKELINRISIIIPKKTTLPVLETIKIKASGKCLRLDASDGCDYVTFKTNADVLEDGETWAFLDDLKKLPNIDDKITISTKDGKLDARSEKKSVEIDCWQYENEAFNAPEVSSDMVYFQKYADFIKLLSGIDSFRDASERSSNLLLTTFFFDFKEKKIVTLDGHRIGIAKMDSSLFVNDASSVIINGNLYSRLKEFAGKNKNCYISICPDRKYTKFISEDFTYITRNVEGNYFKYNEIVKQAYCDFNYAYSINSKELCKISKEYAKNKDSFNSYIPMIIYNNNGKIATGIQYEGYKTSDVIDVCCINGMETEWYIGINPRYVQDACNVFPNTIEVKGSYNSNKPINIANETFEFLILPINVGIEKVEYVKRQIT